MPRAHLREKAQSIAIKVVVDVAADHDVVKDDVFVGHSVEHLACRAGVAAGGVGAHDFDGDGWVVVEMAIDEVRVEGLECWKGRWVVALV